MLLDKYMRIILFLAPALLWLVPVLAAVPATGQAIEHDELRAGFIEILRENAFWNNRDIRLENFSSRPDTITVPPGPVDFEPVSVMYQNRLGRKIATVSVLVNGREEARIKMFGDLKLYDDVVVAARRLDRGELLNRSDIRVMRQDISMQDTDLIKDPEAVVGMRLKTSLRPGTMLSDYHIEQPPVVRRGDHVKIVARGKGLTVEAPGRVRRNAARGEIVRVKNLMSRREVFAEVVSENTVLVVF